MEHEPFNEDKYFSIIDEVLKSFGYEYDTYVSEFDFIPEDDEGDIQFIPIVSQPRIEIKKELPQNSLKPEESKTYYKYLNSIDEVELFTLKEFDDMSSRIFLENDLGTFDFGTAQFLLARLMNKCPDHYCRIMKITPKSGEICINEYGVEYLFEDGDWFIL